MASSNSINSSNEPSALAIRQVTYDKIIIFGDSITELSNDILSLSFALSPALQHHYFRKLAIVTRGYGGYSSEHLQHVLVPTLRAETAAGEKVKLLVLEVGTNDASTNAMQCVSTERFRENMKGMVEKAKEEGVERVIVIGPGPVDEGKLASPIYNSTMRNRAYADTAKEVAEDCGVPFIDLWHAFLEASGWKKGQPIFGQGGSSKGDSLLGDLLTDGVHFSGDGYRIWYEELLKTIQEKFPELMPENFPTVLPHIFDVDRTNLPATLWQKCQIK